MGRLLKSDSSAFQSALGVEVRRSLSATASHQSVEIFPGVRQAVDALAVPVVEQELVFVKQRKRFLHRANGGVNADLRLPNLIDSPIPKQK